MKFCLIFFPTGGLVEVSSKSRFAGVKNEPSRTAGPQTYYFLMCALVPKYMIQELFLVQLFLVQNTQNNEWTWKYCIL